jgi:hypothetical protein
LDVAWRSSASAISSGAMPQPSSVTSIRDKPPSASETAIRVAPASIAFSTISLSAEAGRSTTSPAAMRLTKVSGRRRICGMARQANARVPEFRADQCKNRSIAPQKIYHSAVHTVRRRLAPGFPGFRHITTPRGPG